MSEQEKRNAIAKIEGAVVDAFWAGLTDEEIRSVFTAALLKRPR